jgi:hypothetical protein
MLKLFILPVMLIGLPILGILLTGHPIERYLEFPPRTLYVIPAAFSWAHFAAFSVLVLTFTAPLLKRCIHAAADIKPEKRAVTGFPWWGWMGLIIGSIFWVLAWSRFMWFTRFQAHTFTPLWLCYTLVINALCFRRTGRCMLIHRTGYFLLLFPISAMFWWFFEYLNRFVQNWYYTGVLFSPWKYFLFATLSFSTVLPAVLGTRDWLMGASRIESGFNQWFPIKVKKPISTAVIGLFLSGIGLAGISIWPDYLFPLLWVSPLVVIVSIQTLANEHHILSDLHQGNWQKVVSAALAAVICGLFWEMWNYWSLAKWEYRVPFVHRFFVFEMPILGYAGYLPFGLECALIGNMVNRFMNSRAKSSSRQTPALE